MVEILITLGLILIVTGVALYTFASWLENNDEWFYGTVVNWSFIF